MYTVSYEHPHFDAGKLFGIAGLGQVENGGTLEVDEDMERNFLAQRGITLEDAFADDTNVKLSGSSELDPQEVKNILSLFAPAPVEATTTATEPATEPTLSAQDLGLDGDDGA